MEKAMAPHSSTLAWKIPWTEEPGRLQSMGSRRVGHDWATSLSLFTFMHWRRKWQPTPVFLLGESRGWGSLVGCRLWGRAESDTTEVMQQQQQPLRINCWSDFYQTSLVAQTVKNLPARQENWVWSSGEGNGNPLQYCLKNSMGRGAWWAKVHGLQKIRHDWASNPFTYTLHCLLSPWVGSSCSRILSFIWHDFVVVVVDHAQES